MATVAKSPAPTIAEFERIKSLLKDQHRVLTANDLRQALTVTAEYFVELSEIRRTCVAMLAVVDQRARLEEGPQRNGTLSEILRQPWYVTTEELEFLDRLRITGSTNMFGAQPALAAEFGLPDDEARDVLVFWMQSYGQRHLEGGE
jgi:hypothetical protein